jgi:hypothetical protein
LCTSFYRDKVVGVFVHVFTCAASINLFAAVNTPDGITSALCL